MKKRKIKSYYTVFLVETVIMFLVILNSFNSGLSNVYVLPFILFVCDVIFFFVLGFEKSNKRLNKIVDFDILDLCQVFRHIFLKDVIDRI